MGFAEGKGDEGLHHGWKRMNTDLRQRETPIKSRIKKEPEEAEADEEQEEDGKEKNRASQSGGDRKARGIFELVHQ